MTVWDLGSRYDERRAEWEAAVKDLDPDDDRYLVAIARNLGLGVDPPAAEDFWSTVDPHHVVCPVDGNLVWRDAVDAHRANHELLMAATKVAGWQANLAVVATMFTGALLRELLEPALPEPQE